MPDYVTSVLSFDFDGTLVDPEDRIAFHAPLLEYVNALRSEGAVWVVNSGRSLFHVLEGLQEHGIRPFPDYIIAHESQIYHQGRFNRWVDFGGWNKRCQQDHRKFFRGTSRLFKRLSSFVEGSTSASFLPNAEGPPGIVAQSEEEMTAICEYIEHEQRKAPALGYQRNGVFLRFSHADYSKGTALGELGRILEIESKYVFAAGDNYNDLSMFDERYACAVACPGNSVPAVKTRVAEMGGFVAEAPFSHGLGEAVKHFYFR